jgi:hypothetical protein
LKNCENPITKRANPDTSNPIFSGLEDWTDTDVLTRVIVASQQEYLESLKKKSDSSAESGPSSENQPEERPELEQEPKDEKS